MRKLTLLLTITLMALFVVACGNNDAQDDEELLLLEVEFEPEQTATVGDTVELIATVTYGDEAVTDADEMEFEYWIGTGDEDADERDSTTVEATNNEDGTYSYDLTLEEAGQYWIYAHTTARDLHTMPKRSIEVE